MRSWNSQLKQVLISWVLLLPGAAWSSTASMDTLFVSTITGQASSSGIIFSSSIYLAQGSSLTLQGAQGYITTSSSITASAFFGDGSHLGGIGILAANETFTGANTFISSFTVQSQGRQIILSTSSSANTISISTLGAVSFFPELHNSSHTIMPSGSTTSSTFGPCMVGSTVTITTSGGRVELLLSGYLENTNNVSGGIAAASILQDGAFVRDLTSTRGIVRMGEGAGIASFDGGPFRYLLDAPVTGTHSYCLSLAAPNGGSTYIDDTSFMTNIFYVQEIK